MRGLITIAPQGGNWVRGEGSRYGAEDAELVFGDGRQLGEEVVLSSFAVWLFFFQVEMQSWDGMERRSLLVTGYGKVRVLYVGG